MLLRSMYLDILFNVSEVCELLFYFLSRGSSSSVTQMFPLMSWCQLKINVYIIYTFIFKFHKYYMWNISMKWKSKGEFFLFWWSFNVIMWSHYIVYGTCMQLQSIHISQNIHVKVQECEHNCNKLVHTCVYVQRKISFWPFFQIINNSKLKLGK